MGPEEGPRPVSATPRARLLLRRAGVGLAPGLGAHPPGLDALGRWLVLGVPARCASGRFDAAAWRDPARAHSPPAVRGCMVGDLRGRRALVGRTRAEAVALLGEPAPTQYFGDWDLAYWLGPEGGLAGIDSEWLVLRLDGAGRVAEHRVVTD